MNVKDVWHGIKCFGSTNVGSRGQVVVPANARKELEIGAGDTLLVFKMPHAEGVMLLKTDAVEEMLSTMSERLANFEKLARDYGLQRVAKEG